QLRTRAPGHWIEEEVRSHLHQARRAKRQIGRASCREIAATTGDANDAVAIQILVEAGLRILQRGARARDDADIRYVIAAAVRLPDRVLIRTPVLPRNLVAARRRLHAQRRPRPELANRHGLVLIAQLRTRAPGHWIKEEVRSHLHQARRAKR